MDRAKNKGTRSFSGGKRRIQKTLGMAFAKKPACDREALRWQMMGEDRMNSHTRIIKGTICLTQRFSSHCPTKEAKMRYAAK